MTNREAFVVPNCCLSQMHILCAYYYHYYLISQQSERWWQLTKCLQLTWHFYLENDIWSRVCVCAFMSQMVSMWKLVCICGACLCRWRLDTCVYSPSVDLALWVTSLHCSAAEWSSFRWSVSGSSQTYFFSLTQFSHTSISISSVFFVWETYGCGL